MKTPFITCYIILHEKSCFATNIENNRYMPIKQAIFVSSNKTNISIISFVNNNHVIQKVLLFLAMV